MKWNHLYNILFFPILIMGEGEIIKEVIRGENGLLDRVVYIEITKNSSRKVKTIDFYDNGNKFRSRMFNKTGGIDIVKEWYRNGQIKLEQRFRAGKKNGQWITWYENGVKESEKNYFNGLIHGLVQQWNLKGEIRYKGNFIADTLKNSSIKDGWTTEWFENGQKKLEQHYNRGRLDGLSNRWYRSGQRLETGKFYNGSGISYTWDENGKKIRERIFENGIPTKK